MVSRRVGEERLREVLGKSRSSVGEESAGEERCREVLGSVGKCWEVLLVVCCFVICC